MLLSLLTPDRPLRSPPAPLRASVGRRSAAMVFAPFQRAVAAGRGSIDDDGELAVNPPTPRQIGKYPPAPKIRPANEGRAVKGI